MKENFEIKEGGIVKEFEIDFKTVTDQQADKASAFSMDQPLNFINGGFA